MTTIEQIHKAFLGSSGACTDTRDIAEGVLFFALKGQRFDANAFAAEALGKGARQVVVDDPQVVRDERYLLVPNVLVALQELGRHHRRTFNIPVIGITGSNGKTTTKELLHAVLAVDRPTLATTGNLNNHIGVPLTLLGLTGEHRIAIIEMGANKPGDIAELAAIAEPTHALITNIGRAHLEGFGGLEGVVRTKTELYAHIKAHGGQLFVNADDGLLMEKSAGLRRATYGTTPKADTSGALVGEGPFMELVFAGRDGRAYHVATRLIGDYNLPNALAAVAIGQYFGVADDRIAEALAAYVPGNNRSEFRDTGRNQLVMDAYNANPTSMAAALRNLAAMRSDRPKLAILGDMLELGADSAREHEAIVALVKDLGLAARFVGPEFQLRTKELSYPDAASLLGSLNKEPLTGHLVLVKGSRGIRLEAVVEAL
ncbi:MAG: UDP-N-acetylmuramoyl-tripeptide--D-alanyl-D-alanine ligase [Flavobacteriales bacterium]|nr:UDP-N-acetylmuramoyl-tripeptide--D-alanyl-D-alanine ligase [Flavobacteriales bacterium]